MQCFRNESIFTSYGICNSSRQMKICTKTTKKANRKIKLNRISTTPSDTKKHSMWYTTWHGINKLIIQIRDKSSFLMNSKKIKYLRNLLRSSMKTKLYWSVNSVQSIRKVRIDISPEHFGRYSEINVWLKCISMINVLVHWFHANRWRSIQFYLISFGFVDINIKKYH